MELVIILFYCVCIVLYGLFYVYVIKRIWEFRIVGDRSRESIIIFLLGIAVILVVSILMIMVQFVGGPS